MGQGNTSDGFLAGAARTDITPEKGIQIAGDIGRRRPVEEIRAPLYAKALVLQQDDRTACILSLDVTGVMRPWALKLRRQVADLLDKSPRPCSPTHCRAIRPPSWGTI